MILTPNAKINVGLDVVRKRADGYHDIETLFVPVPDVRDVLEVVKADEADMTCYGTPCDVPVEKNLCFKAFRLMQKNYGISDVHIYLYKNIPMGAGLGGGSSDAAFTLIALNEVFLLGLSQERLAEIAAELGSDCPFFIYNRPMFASGRGEILEPFDIDLSPYRIEVVTPGIHISTAEAYKGVDAIKGFGDAVAPGAQSEEQVHIGNRREESTGPERSLVGAISAGQKNTASSSNYLSNLKLRLSQGILNWRENVVNDFEAYAFAKYPILADIKNDLYSRGAIYASMTGSGSAIYGIFPK